MPARPVVPDSCFVHSRALVVGDVVLGERTSVWPMAVLRGDIAPLRIGDDCNFQEGAVCHADPGAPLTVGNRVTVGHGGILHGCTVEDDVLIGMRATVLNGAHIGAGSLIAAGAVVTEGTKVPPGSLVVGLPGKVLRQDPALVERTRGNALRYVELAKRYKAGEFAPPASGVGREFSRLVP
ncbi:MAG TPA: gamma carbonic anhydrase family protein, partial [Candidatus Thermoplasmatota archaeon]|nr:gamma carbonic anhydrase family protein [Candidatus Thermoplasmatota archaeon]